MEKLVEVLKNETKGLKAQYVSNCIEWAKVEHAKEKEMRGWKPKQWCEFLGIEAVLNSNNNWTYPSWFYHNKVAKTKHNRYEKAWSIGSRPIEKHLAISEQKAIEHYENSIVKLASRVAKKNLDSTKLKAETSHVGVNIETTLTDGEKTVRAWTIIASGFIQKPHYRYLIK